jgi:hypothetical protein
VLDFPVETSAAWSAKTGLTLLRTGWEGLGLHGG